jgi:hypothetical protein
MLQAQLRDPFGREITLLDGMQGIHGGQLGFSIGGMISSIGSAIGSGASAVAGGVVDAANTVGGGVASGIKSIPSAVGGIASMACGVVNNSTVQQGAALASKVPSSYTQGAAAGVAVGSSICNMANPPKTSSQTATKVNLMQFKPSMAAVQQTAAAAAQAAPAQTAAQSQFPAGSIQWQSSKDGLWHYAIPKAVAKTMGLGATPDIGLLGPRIGFLGAGLGQTFVDPWTKAAKFTSPYAMPTLRQRWLRQYNWTSVNTADKPYLATWGLGETHTEVGAGAAQAPGVSVVTESAGKKATTPFYKKWWFWAAVGGGVLATGGTAVYFIRKRKS